MEAIAQSSAITHPSTLTHPSAFPSALPRQDDLRLTFAPLSVAEAYALADCPQNGAVVLMSGTVRSQTDGRAVNHLEYQAYEPMAQKVFEQIASEIRQRWPAVNTVIIHHRVGRLTIGEISVIVAIGCPHRAEAFEACRYGIDTLKHQAPIWKKEHWQDGSSSWVSIGACEQLEPVSSPIQISLTKQSTV